LEQFIIIIFANVGENDAPSNYWIEKYCQLLDICVTMVDCLKQKTLNWFSPFVFASLGVVACAWHCCSSFGSSFNVVNFSLRLTILFASRF
jgi:hypothetical protein